MILSPHAIFGAAVASLVPNHPVFGFGLGFISHFVLDAIPHKDYKLISTEAGSDGRMESLNTVERKTKLTRDIILVSFDAFIGLYLSFIFFFNLNYPWIFLIGVIGSLLPDFFTFLYLILKHKPFILFFKFHASIIHSKIILKLNQITGVVLQFITVAILITIIYGIKSLIV